MTYDGPETITLLHDSDDSEGSLFSYIHDAIYHWDNENNGGGLASSGILLPIAEAVWEEVLTRRAPEPDSSGTSGSR
jgi:hypothetical protein